ncbi:phage head closure protein, partial [Shigella flexneri]
MNIGRLRDRITIQTLKQTRDITGEILETWEDGHTLWASVNMVSSKEAISSGAELAI